MDRILMPIPWSLRLLSLIAEAPLKLDTDRLVKTEWSNLLGDQSEAPLKPLAVE